MSLKRARRREQALAVVELAAEKVPQAEALRARARVLREEGEARLAEVKPWQSEEDKAVGWAKEDEAARRDATREEALLRTHVAALPQDHPLRGECTACHQMVALRTPCPCLHPERYRVGRTRRWRTPRGSGRARWLSKAR